MAKLETLKDNFDDNHTDTVYWYPFSTLGASIAETGAQVDIIFPASSVNGTDADYTSNNRYDFAESYASIRVNQVPSAATSADAELRVVKNVSTDWFRWVYEGGTLFAQDTRAGVKTTRFSVAYNSTTHKYWRVRESGGTVYWDTSTDGSSWTNRASLVHGLDVSSMYAIISGSCFQNETNPGHFIFDEFNTANGELLTPHIVTDSVGSIAQSTAIPAATIHGTGGATITQRGFQFNTVAYPDRETSTTGSYSYGSFTASLSDLIAGQTYYVRAFAVNSVGTGYGDWVSFTALAATYTVTINGVDRSGDIVNGTIRIDDILNDQQNSCTFILDNRQGLGVPSNDQEIIITLNSGVRLFAGYITQVNLGGKLRNGAVQITITCTDYSYLLDRNLAHKTYQDMTDKAIIEDIISTYCSGFGITTTDVISTVTIDQISFNYIQPTQALRKIADLTGNNWYIDYSKGLHYFPLTTNAAPFDIDSGENEYFELAIKKDATQIKNRVYVRGGTYLSDTFTYEEKGDAKKRVFVLPDKPHDITLAINGVSKTIGIKNIDLSGFDAYVNFQEKYVELDSGVSTPGTGDTLTFTYKYDVPILIAQENTSSIMTHGVKEFAIFDKSITTTQAARDRALAELTDYANNIIEGSFKTYTAGFFSGQYVNINLTEYDINADYIVTKVNAVSYGAGNYVYTISIASAKTLGIIRFLIELLESNKNLIELDDQETVDELLAIEDSLLSDSLTDMLTIDSTGAYFTWCPDSLTASPITRARWDLFQWG